jgi:parallel beta-helix repeat protein
LVSQTTLLGRGATIKTLGTAVAGERLLRTASNVENIRISGLVFDGNKGVVPGDPLSGVPLVELSFGYSATDVLLDACEFRNNGYIAFRCLSSAEQVQVVGCRFYDTDAGCWFGLADASRVLVSGCRFHSGLSEGVTVDLAGGYTYDDFAVTGCVCYNKISLLFVDGAVRRLAVVGNTAQGTATGTGIRIDNGDGSPQGATVSGNVVSGFGVGIHLKGSNITCAGNTVSTGDLEGILSEASRCTISGNTVVDINRRSGTPNRSGIDITSGTDVLVVGNSISDSAGSPIHYDGIRVRAGDRVVILENSVRGYTNIGIQISNTATSVRCRGNGVTGGGSNTILVDSNADTVVSACAGNTTDTTATYSINANAVNIRAEDFVTLSNGGSSQLDTITSVSKHRGRMVVAAFPGVTTISHNVGNIKTRTGANQVTAANAQYLFVSDGTSWWLHN